MADCLLKAAEFTNHLHHLARNLLTYVSRKNGWYCHWKKKGLPLPRTTNNKILYLPRCQDVSESYSSLYSVHFANCLKYFVSGQFVNSYVTASRFRSMSFVNLHNSPTCYIQVRHKSNSSQKNTNDESDDSDDDAVLEDDDFDAPSNFKIRKLNVVSTRADTVVSHALDIGRNNLEEVFLGSGLYLNGSKLTKKSVKLDTGDYVDFVVDKSDDELKVKRVKIIRIYNEKTSKDKMKLKLRVWKTPFSIAKPEREHKE